MRKLLIVLIASVAFAGVGIPKAKAMDPITIAMLAPYALPVAEVAGAYALKGFTRAAAGVPDIFTDMVDVFMLPVGVFEVTLGWPFGFFGSGCRHVGVGAIAPLKLCYSTVMLVPLFFIGMFQ